MRKTIEKQVSETILEKGKNIEIGGVVYEVTPPSSLTLIMVSELVSELPTVDMDQENILMETLYIAKDCRLLGDILATLILGGNNVKSAKKKSFFQKKSKYDVLTEKVLELEPKKLQFIITELLSSMQIGHFFGVTTSLIGVNLLRRTREEVGEKKS